MNSELTGMDDPVDGSGLDERRAVGRGPTRAPRRDQPQRREQPFACHDNPPGSVTSALPVRSARAASWPPPTPDRAPALSGVRPGRRRVLQAQIGVRERDVRAGGVPAPDRNLQRGHRLRRPARAQVDAPEQQVRLGFVGRQEDGAAQLDGRLAILLRLEQPPAALEMELREVALIALARWSRSPGRRRWRATTRDPARCARGRAAADRRRPAGSAYVADNCAASSRSRPASTVLPDASSADGEDEMRVAVGRVAAQAPRAASKSPPGGSRSSA